MSRERPCVQLWSRDSGVAAHLLTHSTVSLLVVQGLSVIERAHEFDEELAPPLRASFHAEDA
jgi:hypothetical protein